MASFKYSLLALAAMGFACCLLAFQIVGGLEYTEGASPYTRASMVVAMVTVALLPIFIEASRRLSKWLVLPLLTAFIAFLGYSLPAQVGRVGEIREVKASDAKLSQDTLARVKADYAKADKLVDEATRWQATECASGNGTKCQAQTFTLNQRKAYLEKLSKQLQDVKPSVGDLGSETVAWALSGLGLAVSPDVIRKASGLLLAIGLEIAIWSLMWLGTAAVSRAIKSVGHAGSVPMRTAEPEPAPVTEADLEDLIVKAVRERFAGVAPSQEAIVDEIGMSKANVSRRVDALVETGRVVKIREGRRNVIRFVA